MLDASGEIVAPGDVVGTADLMSVGVPPNGLTRRFTWRGRSGLSEGGEPLPAGVYRMIGGPGPTGHVTGSVSGPVAIEIVEP